MLYTYVCVSLKVFFLTIWFFDLSESSSTNSRGSSDLNIRFAKVDLEKLEFNLGETWFSYQFFSFVGVESVTLDILYFLFQFEYFIYIVNV